MSTKKSSKTAATIVRGATTYVRTSVKTKDELTGESGKAYWWIAQPKTSSDKEFCWIETPDESGTGVYYVNIANPDMRRWDLPDVDINTGKPRLPGEYVEETMPNFLEKTTAKERKEWGDDKLKKPVVLAAKKVTDTEKKVYNLSEEEASLIASNIGKEYMAENRKWEAETGEPALSQAASKAASSLAEKKKAWSIAAAERKKKATSLSTALNAAEDLPEQPLATGVAPASPLLPRAHYLRDPYYSRRLKVANFRRTIVEEKLQQLPSINAPGRGTHSVLAAVPVKISGTHEIKCLAAVVRDWSGAFVMMLVEAPADEKDAEAERFEQSVLSVYPIVDHVEFPDTGRSDLKVCVDDNEFVMTFPDQFSAWYLRDALKMAMSSMYQLGDEDERIVIQRGRSVEYAGADEQFYPKQQPIDTVVPAIINDFGISGEDKLAPLRVALRKPMGRQKVLQLWSRSMQDGPGYQKRTKPETVTNHLRIIEECVRHPTAHEDVELSRTVQSQLSQMLTDQPPETKAQIEATRARFKITEDTMLNKYESRDQLENAPLERAFEIVNDTDAAVHLDTVAANIRKEYAQKRLPPGIYFTLMIYSGDSLMVDGQGNLFSEVIVPYPNEKELQDLTAASDDFRWILRLGGANESWSETEVEPWSEIFDNTGSDTFRARFLHAARRLKESLDVPSLGIVFDTPIVHEAVGCAHIMTVLRVDHKDNFPSSMGSWMPITQFESRFYNDAGVASSSDRIAFLPTTSTDCKRCIKAAKDYREDLTNFLKPGFYVGFAVISNSSNGPMVLVPESNRNLLPLTRVSDDAPTLEQWRWVQGLNERRKRTGNFFFVKPDPSTDLPEKTSFNRKFAKAVSELEFAVGVNIEKFYDIEMFVLDEHTTSRGVFGVHHMPMGYEVDHNQKVQLTTPNGNIPMVWKHIDVLEDTAFRLSWPNTFTALIEERNAQQRRAYATVQPFTTDEIFRHQQESSVGRYVDMDKYGLLVSWVRPLATWILRDGKTLVEKYGGGSSDEVMLRSVEEAVETAVSNHASGQDMNVQTMKSILHESAVTQEFDAAWMKLREVDRIVQLGYAQRIVTEVPEEDSSSLKFRTYDELPGEPDSDDEGTRDATDYHVPCTIEELVMAGDSTADIEASDRYFSMRDIVLDIVDLAVIDGPELKEIRDIGECISDLVTCIELTEDLADGAELLATKEAAEAAAMKERENFQRFWLDLYKDEEAASGRSMVVPNHYDEEDDAPHKPLLFYDGSSAAIQSAEDGIRVCLARSANTTQKLANLLKATSSAMVGLELSETIQEYSSTLNKRESLVGMRGGILGEGQHRPSGFMHNQAFATTAADTAGSFNIISKSDEEFAVRNVDPLRCLALHGVTENVRFSSLSSQSLEVLVNHLNLTSAAVPRALSDLVPANPAEAEMYLQMALQMKAPILALHFATLLFRTPGRDGGYELSMRGVETLQTLFADGFMFEYGVKDWLAIEELGGDDLDTAMDVMWWLRYQREAVVSDGGQQKPFDDHEGTWKQVYAETRVRVFLSFGVHALSKDEVSLWSSSLGRHVEYLSLNEASIGDPEIDLLVTTCPNLKSLNLTGTSITSRSVTSITQNLHRLIEFSAANLSADLQDTLKRHCNLNLQRA